LSAWRVLCNPDSNRPKNLPSAMSSSQVLHTGAAHGYCVGLITPASMAGVCIAN